MIPKGRFDEVLGERNTLREEKREFENRMAALESKLTPKEESALPDPPSNLSERETIEWYVENGATRAIENKLGMSLDAARTLLAGSKATAEQSNEARWNSLCAKHKLDPSDRMVQATVTGLMQGGKMTPEEAVKQTATRFGAFTKKPVATVPDGTQSGVMTQSDRQPKTREEAVEMAQAGQIAKQRSTLEILAKGK